MQFTLGYIMRWFKSIERRLKSEEQREIEKKVKTNIRLCRRVLSNIDNLISRLEADAIQSDKDVIKSIKKYKNTVTREQSNYQDLSLTLGKINISARNPCFHIIMDDLRSNSLVLENIDKYIQVQCLLLEIPKHAPPAA